MHKEEAQKIREEKKERYRKEVENLEKNKGETNAQKELRELRIKLLRLADREMEDVALYFWERWVGKVDRPSHEMFRMLKVKHATEFIPLLKDNFGA